MVVAFARLTIFEVVAAKEKLADVTTDTMLDYKFAARMLIHEFIDLHNQIVDKNEFFTFRNSFIKIVHSHVIMTLVKEWNMSSKSLLVTDLQKQNSAEKDGYIQNY